jgi:hypothetical protein
MIGKDRLMERALDVRTFDARRKQSDDVLVPALV